MDIILNDYIDFKGMFDALVKENNDDMIQHKYESETFGKILRFLDEDYNNSTIISGESRCDEGRLVFCFEKVTQTANESNPTNETELFVIEFDNYLSEFDSFYYEGA